jgi:hypothetical protein
MPPPDTRAPPVEDKVVVHPVAEADATVARIAARLSSEFFFRAAALISELADGDLMEGLILRSIIAANTNHFDGRANLPPWTILSPMNYAGRSASWPSRAAFACPMRPRGGM